MGVKALFAKRLNSSAAEAPTTGKRIGGRVLTPEEVEKYRGKFRRMCEPKKASGKIEVPQDIFDQFQSKGASRERLFEAFVRSDGQKD